ncbi:MAG: sugar phosphate isomerase/epimerase [Clostridiales bacterium]|jgi:sugar phosphate isomerase/epimerase|nr:sugar phosphate isomerase/epimerase [Clostridiales bacterium]
MKIGVRAHDFGRHTAADLPRIIRQAGFEAVQLAIPKAITGIAAFAEVDDHLLEEIHKNFHDNQLEIAVMGCYIEPSLPDKTERLAQVEIFKLGLGHAAKLGVNIVGTETTHLDIDASPADREKSYQFLKDSMLRMAEEAKKLGVCIGIEPVAEHVLNTPELTARLFDEVDSDKLRIIFDPVNLMLPRTIHSQLQIYRELFEHLGEKIAVLHMKDTDTTGGAKAWRNIGRGQIDYDFIFKWLHRHKPGIPLLREDAQMDSYTADIEAMLNFANKS